MRFLKREIRKGRRTDCVLSPWGPAVRLPISPGSYSHPRLAARELAEAGANLARYFSKSTSGIFLNTIPSTISFLKRIYSGMFGFAALVFS